MDQDRSRDDRESRVGTRAYAIWEAEGRPHGRHEDHWQQAEADEAAAGRIDPDRAADAAPGPLSDEEDLRQRQDQLLDEALEETFPGSDPIAPKRIT